MSVQAVPSSVIRSPTQWLVGPGFAKGQALKPELFNRVLRGSAATPAAALVNELVLRCQAQAVYSPKNIGHFGLALRRYAHFTSPIRRYADLLVHRALLGEPIASPEKLTAIAEGQVNLKAVFRPE